MPLGLNGRFFETTRGRIGQRLRRATGAVEELAQHLNLTDNAIRSHLATLSGCGACPLGSAAAEHPELCHAIESLLSDVVGIPA